METNPSTPPPSSATQEQLPPSTTPVATTPPPSATPIAAVAAPAPAEKLPIAIAAADKPDASVASIPDAATAPAEKVAAAILTPTEIPTPNTSKATMAAESAEQHTPLEPTIPVPALTQTPTEEPVKVPPTAVAEEPTTDMHVAATEEVVTSEPVAEKPTIDLPIDPLPSTADDPEEKRSANPDAQTEDRELPAENVDSFKEESYYLRDLKESQKKALAQFKAKIQAAIMDKSFLESPKPAKAIDVEEKEVAKEEEKKEEATREEEKKEEGEGEKLEEAEVKKDVSDDVIAQLEAPINTADEVATRELAPAAEAVPEPHEPTLTMPEPHEPTSTTREIHVDVVHEPAATDDTAPPAHPADDEPSLDDLALWGIPLLHSKGDERTDVLLLKFLRARDFKVDKALNMLQDTMVWRKDFNTDSLIEEEMPADFRSSFIHGVDRDGHPVCYNGELSSKKSVGDEAQLKKRIQVLEKGIQGLDFHPNGVHSMVQVIDFAGHSPAFLRRGIRSKILNMLQDNYPELVAKQIFINVPWYFKALRFFDIYSPRTKSKVVVARPGRVAETLFKYISPDQVPVQYGGLSRLIDADFEGTDAPVSRVTVKAGEKQSIELPVAEAGRVVWDIAIIGWDVLYDEEFVPTEGYTRIIRKASKVATLEEPIRNAFAANEPGKVVLTINNSTSRRKKAVIYRHIIKPAASHD